MSWFVAAAVVSGGVAVACCVAVTAHLRVTLVVVTIGVAVLGAATGVAFVFGLGRGMDFFGITHVVYLQTTVALPVLGAGLLALSRWRGASAAGIVAAALLVVPAPIGFWATHVAPFRLQVDRHEVPVPDEREGAGAVRVAVLADLQTTGVGEHERRAVQEVMDAEPDVIVLPGDLFQADGQVLVDEGPAVRELLGELRAPGGVYLVEGDVDSAERLDVVVPDNVTRLDDEVVEVQVRDRRIRIGGTRLDVVSPDAEEVRRDLRRSAATGRGGALTVLVSHRPDTVLHLPPDSGVDLAIAGHTHGGQIAIPFLGPPLTLSSVPRAVGAGGLHEVAGNPIYVSTGVGMERGQAPQVRLFVPPSIAVLELG